LRLRVISNVELKSGKKNSWCFRLSNNTEGRELGGGHEHWKSSVLKLANQKAGKRAKKTLVAFLHGKRREIREVEKLRKRPLTSRKEEGLQQYIARGKRRTGLVISRGRDGQAQIPLYKAKAKRKILIGHKPLSGRGKRAVTSATRRAHPDRRKTRDQRHGRWQDADLTKKRDAPIRCKGRRRAPSIRAWRRGLGQRNLEDCWRRRKCALLRGGDAPPHNGALYIEKGHRLYRTEGAEKVLLSKDGGGERCLLSRA